jgi:SAM-dependent methyltransferase
MKPLTLPDDAVRFIAFQRAEALLFPRIPGYSLVTRILPRSFYHFGVTLESRFRTEGLKAFYASDMVAEFNSIRAYLPVTVSAILDIGCGVAAIDALLSEHFRSSDPEIYLLDKSATDTSVYYGFKPHGAFYNSLETAAIVLRANGVNAAKVHLLEANAANEIAIAENVDLVLSLISWGFHYPIDTYLRRVYELLNPGGCAILDVRKGTDGKAKLGELFRQVDVINDQRKFERVRAEK